MFVKMHLIKVKKNEDLVVDEIVKNLDKFPVSEKGSLINFQVKEITEVTAGSKDSFQRSEQNVFIGRDHSITLPILKSFVQFYPNAGVVIFDAHPDCSGVEDLVSGLVGQNIISRENIVLVGLRNWTLEEFNFLKQNNIKHFTMQEITLEGKFEVSESVMANARRFEALYISVDADVLDPAFVSVDTPEPGGLSVREFLFFLHRLKRLRNFKAADLCEVRGESALVGAKIVGELCK